MIEIVKYMEPPTVIMSSPEGEIHILNEYEWVHLRVQIKREKAEGWVWLNARMENPVEINSKGEPAVWPPQFNLMDDLLSELYNMETV